MQYKITTATRKVAAMRKRIRAVQGGTSASKTVSILLCLIDIAQQEGCTDVISVVSESVPHLKRGAMRDFRGIMESQGYWRDRNWNATDSIYTFETGAIIEFFSTDNGDKLRGARRDWCFMNEANNNTLDAFDQLEVRTKKGFFLDWNPSTEFWFYTELLGKRDDVEHLILTYRDNEALDAQIVASIEQRRSNPSWFRVYGDGLLGEVEGRVFSGWRIVDSVPFEARLQSRGLDFGFSNDEAAIVDIYYMDGGYVLDEQLYLLGQSNRALADFLLPLPSATTRADQAEPKSIAELQSYGVRVIGAAKGADSRIHGIRFLQDQKISVTKRSVNLIKEYRNLMFERDKKTGKFTTDTVGVDNAIDATRYGFDGKWQKHAQAGQFVPNHAERAQVRSASRSGQFVPRR